MQLYKSRGFGEYFQDTFAFLKQNGGHLFKNFFIINGIFLLILMVMTYFFGEFYTDMLFSGINGTTNPIDNYLNDNAGLFFLFAFVFIVVALVAAMISYSFLPIYLKLFVKANGKHFNATDILNVYKANIGKIFIFLLCAVLIAIPLAIFIGLLSFVLAITFVGLLALPLVIGGVSLYYQGALMEYFENKKGIWESFGYSWKLMSSKFWAAIGCAGLFYLMSYIIQNVVSLVPYIFGMINMYTDFQPGVNPDPEEVGKTVTFLMIMVFLITFFVSSLLNIIVQLNQGIIFYSLKEDNENIGAKSDIDLIGSGE
ncbi:hypothetical protein [Psychroserpens luteolus]|uniref:hypothetical protein n=1 Tax=Psychroserpens luteolus TaxID=2855840 RepID=UPI001E297FCF|nr:hypothetical protein [Psychroserpens luteolus]MCD2260913.1 hypothetical protein [Psychroserpens luteolus]